MQSLESTVFPPKELQDFGNLYWQKSENSVIMGAVGGRPRREEHTFRCASINWYNPTARDSRFKWYLGNCEKFSLFAWWVN